MKKSYLELRAENHLDRQSVVGFFPLGSYSAPFASKPLILAVSKRFSKSENFRFKAENRLDRQNAVGFPPKGSHSAPFA